MPPKNIRKIELATNAGETINCHAAPPDEPIFMTMGANKLGKEVDSLSIKGKRKEKMKNKHMTSNVICIRKIYLF